MTRQVNEAADLLGLDLADHIIVGQDRWISLKERGLGFGQAAAAGLDYLLAGYFTNPADLPTCRSDRAKQKRSRDRADRRASISFFLCHEERG